MKWNKILCNFLLIILICHYDNVYAGQELTCIYEGGLQAPATMLVQTAEGKHLVYTNIKNKKPEIDDINWYSIDDNALDVNYEWDTGYYDKNSKVFSSCPSYTRYKTKSNNAGLKYTFYFYDKKTKSHWDYSLYKTYDYVSSNKDFKQNFTNDDDNIEKIQTTDWIGICNYEDVILYFNQENMILDNKNSIIYSSTAGFSLNELLEYYNQLGICPSSLYQRVDQTVVSLGNTFQYVTYFLSDVGNTYKEKIIEDGSSINNNNKKDPSTPNEIKNCQDLLSQEFIKDINSYLSIIRILVPILLIIMGILDFAKAIFSSSEDEMKKTQIKFMKRVIAAFLVFLIPILVNLLLKMANNIWSFIDPNSCNIGNMGR